MASTKKSKLEVELVPDAWPRFERFIREVAKAGPQHRSNKKRKVAKRKDKKSAR